MLLNLTDITYYRSQVTYYLSPITYQILCNTNSAIGVYNGTGTNTVSIPAATAASVKRRIITEEWWYFMNTDHNNEYETPIAGETRNLNVYFHARYRD